MHEGFSISILRRNVVVYRAGSRRFNLAEQDPPWTGSRLPERASLALISEVGNFDIPTPLTLVFAGSDCTALPPCIGVGFEETELAHLDEEAHPLVDRLKEQGHPIPQRIGGFRRWLWKAAFVFGAVWDVLSFYPIGLGILFIMYILVSFFGAGAFIGLPIVLAILWLFRDETWSIGVGYMARRRKGKIEVYRADDHVLCCVSQGESWKICITNVSSSVKVAAFSATARQALLLIAAWGVRAEIVESSHAPA